MQAVKQTNVTQMLCVRTLKGLMFADAKKDMSEVVKPAQVRKVYRIMNCSYDVRYLFWDLSRQL